MQREQKSHGLDFKPPCVRGAASTAGERSGGLQCEEGGAAPHAPFPLLYKVVYITAHPLPTTVATANCQPPTVVQQLWQLSTANPQLHLEVVLVVCQSVGDELVEAAVVVRLPAPLGRDGEVAAVHAVALEAVTTAGPGGVLGSGRK